MNFTRFILTTLILLQPFLLYAQNLVPNPDFEEYNDCPAALDGVQFSSDYSSFPFVKGWMNPMLQTTSDYYNSCASVIPGTMVGVPQNWLIHKTARSGNAYCGIIPFETAPLQDSIPEFDYREYIECRLLQPLVAGRTYHVSFYVNYAYNTFYTYNWVTVDQIGAYLSDTVIYSQSLYHLSFPPQIASPQGLFFSDTTTWIRISGQYTAHGGEQWLTIGHFDNGQPATYHFLSPATPNPAAYQYSYMFIDDVAVYEGSCDTLKVRHDTALCHLPPAGLLITSSLETATHYIWNTGDTDKQATATDTGVYWCVAYEQCTMHTDSFFIKLKDEPFYGGLFSNPDTVLCPGAEMLLGWPSAGANRYSWNTGDTSCCIIVSGPGRYILTAKDECRTVTDTIAVFSDNCTDCLYILQHFPLMETEKMTHGDRYNDAT